MSWITAQDPKLVGGQYSFDTPHIFFNNDSPLNKHGCHHEWTGAPVTGIAHKHKTVTKGYSITGAATDQIKRAAKLQGVALLAIAKHCRRGYSTLKRGLSGGASFQQVDVDKINELLGLNISLLTD